MTTQLYCNIYIYSTYLRYKIIVLYINIKNNSLCNDYITMIEMKPIEI